MAEVIAASLGAFFGGLAAFLVARWQREQDRAAARRETVAVAVGQLGAAVAELRWEAARLASLPERQNTKDPATWPRCGAAWSQLIQPSTRQATTSE